MSQSALKRPTGVYIVAVLFLLAPFGNIIISFVGSGIINWYNPGVMLPLIQSIPTMDWVWLGLLFLTGVLLFRPHKLTWSLAIFTLLLVLFINAYRLFNIDPNSIDPVFLKVFSVLAMVSTLGILIIAMYFRFPYLDRRANWFSISNAKRYNVKISALVYGEKVLVESLSTSGCRISFNKPNSYKKHDIIKISIADISKIECDAEIVEKLEFGVRAEFVSPSPDFRQDLERWLREHQ